MNLLSTLASEILSEHGCQIVQEEGHDGQLGCGIRLPLGNISFKFISMEDQQSYALLFYVPTNIEKLHRLRILEYISRINYLIPLGHFEMDLDNGIVRFVHTQYKGTKEPDAEELLALMRNGLDRMETFFSGMMRIVHGGLHAEGALAELEEREGYPPLHSGRYPSLRLN